MLFRSYAGSELQKMLTGEINGVVQPFDLDQVHDYMARLLHTMENGHVASCHDLSEGGLGVALAETLFKTDRGLNLNLRHLNSAQLFSETPGRFVVTVRPDHVAAFEQDLGDAVQLVGEVTNTHWLEVHMADNELNLSVDELQKIWEEAIPCQMKSKD